MAHILIIDDTKNIRKMVALTLEHAGHTVQMAEDGAQGLELFADGTQWDLTLVDQRMPAPEGRELIAEARRRDPMARLIMMTAFASAELATEVLEMGAVDFLRKPFSAEVLRGATEAALSHPRHASAPTNSAPSENAPLPAPGQSGFLIPRISFRLNGFSFWPVPHALNQAPQQGMEFGRLFQIRQPGGELSRCFVGLTPHVRQQVQHAIGQVFLDDDPFWEKLCGQAISGFIWEQATTPPDVLPIYEVPINLHHAQGNSTGWGPYADA